jgi:hypothetical protein
MNEYKPNSHRFKDNPEEATNERKKRVEKVINGTAKTKKNEMRKLKDVFISEDIGNVKNYIFMDVLIPAVKKAVSDIVRNGIDMILYGDSGRSSSSSSASKISYQRYYDSRQDDRRYDRTPIRTRYSYDDIILENRGEAEEVLRRMDELVDTYDFVTVADLFDLVGITGEHTDNKYGWTNLRSAEVVRVRDGYTIKLPRAMPIEK